MKQNKYELDVDFIEKNTIMKTFAIFILLFISYPTYAQKWKNLQVVCKDSFDTKIPITVNSLSYDPLNIVSEFTNQLSVAGFKVISEKTAKSSVKINNDVKIKPGEIAQDVSLTKTKEFKTIYAIMVNYTACSEISVNATDVCFISGQVVDLANEGEVVATFSFRQRLFGRKKNL